MSTIAKITFGGERGMPSKLKRRGQRSLWGALAAASVLGLAAPASAAMVVNPNGTVTLTGTSGSTTIDFNGNVEGTPIDGLSALMNISFTAAMNGLYTFTYTLTNTSTAPITSRISGFGFSTDPDALSANYISGILDNVNFNPADPMNVPNGLADVEFCDFAGGSEVNCTGGGGDGITTSGMGSFSLAFGSVQNQITMSDLFVRYQSITGVRAGTSGTGTVVTSVPEPMTWAMMLLGLTGIGCALQRSRRKSPLPQAA